MKSVIGIVPAGGPTRLMHGFFVEMMPLGVNESDKSKFLVTSERIVEGILNAGASSIHFILGYEKSFIQKHYTNEELFPSQISFDFIKEPDLTKGLPYSIASLYDRTKGSDYVLMGFPDNFIEPADSFTKVLEFCQREEADLTLGLYKTSGQKKGGYIHFDPETQVVHNHIDHHLTDLPADADNLWAIACWNRRFNKFIYDFSRSTNQRNLRFGALIDAAIRQGTVKLRACFVDEENGFHWDITDSDKYFELLKYLGTGKRPAAKRIFIGHGNSKCWEQLRDFLHEDLGLECEEFGLQSPVGRSAMQRLQEMMSRSGFGFLIMTAEGILVPTATPEEMKRETRPNVIHEIGYAQASLGHDNVAILVEDGAAIFSNIAGLMNIPFPKGNIHAALEEIKKTLRDRGFLETTHVGARSFAATDKP